jgi:hypothetical protein
LVGWQAIKLTPSNISELKSLFLISPVKMSLIIDLTCNCQAVGWFGGWLVGWKPTSKLTNQQTFPENFSSYPDFKNTSFRGSYQMPGSSR